MSQPLNTGWATINRLRVDQAETASQKRQMAEMLMQMIQMLRQEKRQVEQAKESLANEQTALTRDAQIVNDDKASLALQRAEVDKEPGMYRFVSCRFV